MSCFLTDIALLGHDVDPIFFTYNDNQCVNSIVLANIKC